MILGILIVLALFLIADFGKLSGKAIVTDNGSKYIIELISATDNSAIIKVTDSKGNYDMKEIREADSKKILGIEIFLKEAEENVALGTISVEINIGKRIVLKKSKS